MTSPGTQTEWGKRIVTRRSYLTTANKIKEFNLSSLFRIFDYRTRGARLEDAVWERDTFNNIIHHVTYTRDVTQSRGKHFIPTPTTHTRHRALATASKQNVRPAWRRRIATRPKLFLQRRMAIRIARLALLRRRDSREQIYSKKDLPGEKIYVRPKTYVLFREDMREIGFKHVHITQTVH